MIESDGKYVLLSESGKIIDISDKKQGDVPIVMGAKLMTPKLSSSVKYKDPKVEEYISEILASADEYKFSPLRVIDISNLSKIVIEIKTGLHIVIGTPENIDYKLKTAKKIIDKAIDELLAEQAEAEKRRITIDLSQLGQIRAAAAVTQEALLTDEERGDEPGDAEGAGTSDEMPHAFDAPEEAPLTEEPAPSASLGSVDSPLSSAEIIVVRALLDGEAAPPNPEGQLLSLVIDSINEKLFDIVGDAVIEFDGDTPVLIEDYEQDVREILGL